MTSVIIREIQVAKCSCCGQRDATHEVVVRADDARSDDTLYYRCWPCARELRFQLDPSLGGKP